MTNPSSRSHLYRLGMVLGAAFILFLVIKSLATPASWNYESWYRGDALSDMASEPLAHGGNESCVYCHQDAVKRVKKLRHKRLSCEGCHGALADHVRDGEKIADAIVITESRWQCLNCHSQLISKPKGFPQFTMEVNKHAELEEKTVCLNCHDAHDPTP